MSAPDSHTRISNQALLDQYICSCCKWRLSHTGSSLLKLLEDPDLVLTRLADDGKAETLQSLLSEGIGSGMDVAEVEVVPGDGGLSSEAVKVYCCTCLGILDSEWISQCLRQVFSQLQAAEFDVCQFSLAISLPITVEIRERLLMNRELSNNCAQSLNMINNYVTVKEYLKFLMSVYLERWTKWKCTVASDFVVDLKLRHDILDRIDYAAVREVIVQKGRKRKKKATRSSVESFCKNLPSDFDPVRFLVASCPILAKFKHEIELLREPILIAGRYCKFSRSLNQTPWMVDGQKMSTTSVEELICAVMRQWTGATQSTFTSAGREDMDVRMLGSGRPFLIQLDNPRRKRSNSAWLTDMRETINEATSDIRLIGDLVRVTGNSTYVASIKDGEEQKQKHYSALCWSPNGISDESLQHLAAYKSAPLSIRQRTPLRVMHRRAVTDRIKTIQSMSALKLDEYHFQLDLITQGGTYVKEFIHGDLGRTDPSLGTLLGIEDLDILELDVINILMNWPPPAIVEKTDSGTSSNKILKN